ncbi:Dual specificity phosphatase [Trema orientale]|uniref:Dual specificity phosphatase n=1 Tax=Trema orientale TaxID=63057 RepID=A0A2P5FWP0_TREOI|nr:Dual specificity phosphatase [Trema orientale]
MADASSSSSSKPQFETFNWLQAIAVSFGEKLPNTFSRVWAKVIQGFGLNFDSENSVSQGTKMEGAKKFAGAVRVGETPIEIRERIYIARSKILEEGFSLRRANISLLRMDEDIRSSFHRCLQSIQERINRGQNVLLVCSKGGSRSASIIMAYLITFDHLNLYKAIELVNDRWTGNKPTENHMTQLIRYYINVILGQYAAADHGVVAQNADEVAAELAQDAGAGVGAQVAQNVVEDGLASLEAQQAGADQAEVTQNVGPDLLAGAAEESGTNKVWEQNEVQVHWLV